MDAICSIFLLLCGMNHISYAYYDRQTATVSFKQLYSSRIHYDNNTTSGCPIKQIADPIKCEKHKCFAKEKILHPYYNHTCSYEMHETEVEFDKEIELSCPHDNHSVLPKDIKYSIPKMEWDCCHHATATDANDQCPGNNITVMKSCRNESATNIAALYMTITAPSKWKEKCLSINGNCTVSVPRKLLHVYHESTNAFSHDRCHDGYSLCYSWWAKVWYECVQHTVSPEITLKLPDRIQTVLVTNDPSIDGNITIGTDATKKGPSTTVICLTSVICMCALLTIVVMFLCLRHHSTINAKFCSFLGSGDRKNVYQLLKVNRSSPL